MTCDSTRGWLLTGVVSEELCSLSWDVHAVGEGYNPVQPQLRPEDRTLL